MGARVRAYDWEHSALGPVERWPQSLRSALSICLNSSFPIALYWGRDLSLLYNDDWSPIPGAKHPWALGRPAREAWADIWEIIAPLFERVFTTGEATRSRDQLLPMQRHGFTEECYFDYTFSPIRGESGDVEGVFNAVIETTSRVIGERRLKTLRDLGAWRSSEALTLTAACQNALQVLDQNPFDIPFALLYTVEGPRAVLRAASRVSAQDAGCPPFIDLDGAAAPWPLDAARRQGPVEVDLDGKLEGAAPGAWPEPVRRAVVLPLSRPDQDLPAGFLIAGISPRLSYSAEYRDFFALLADNVTAALAAARAYEEERRRAETLAELDQAKTQFFSNVSHELRTPLTLILGPLEDLLASAPSGDPSVRERLEIARRNAVRLLKLVNTMLDFSRIEAGRLTARFEPTDLPEYTAELASNFRSLCERAGLSLKIDPGQGGGPATYVDRQLWEKVVLNLLSNAFKFTLQGEIRVRTWFEGDEFRLEVADTGIGIPATEVSRVFERFHRVDNAGGRTHEGTGIGLALVSEVVKLHGGRVAATSTPGRGSVFTVSLPAGSAHLDPAHVTTERRAGARSVTDSFIEEALHWLPQAAAAEPAARAPTPAGPAARRPRILWADDNRDMRGYVARLLGDSFEVRAVGDGQAALDQIRDWLPDLVLSDVMMPRLDGFGLLKAIRADASLRHLPVILLSARAGEEARVEGFAADADDYLVKPFNARELRARVEAQLRIAQLRQETNRVKDEFLAMLGHELRNPLAPIMTALYLMRMRGKDELRTEREIIERQVQQLSRLVDDVMDVSRIRAGRIEIKREAVDMATVVRSAVEAVAPLIEQRRHRLELAVEPAWVAGDAARLTQVLTNLLTNAARYTPDGGSIGVTLQAAGDEARLAVRDTGQGIPADLLPRMFDMFTQGRQSLERSSGGLGLGLAIARSLVGLHGGRIEARSDGPGKGAEFVVHLPATDPARVQDGMPGAAAIRAAHAGRRILLVEDNPDSLSTLSAVLGAAGYAVDGAADGLAALELARRALPHVAVIDIGLPGMNGYELAASLRELSASLPIIALTGYGQDKDRARSAEAGIDVHLVKPVDPALLASAIEQRLGARTGTASPV